MTTSHWEVLVEEQSMEELLRILLPRLLPIGTTFKIYSSNGKQDLLKQLPLRLRGYRKWLPSDWRIVVLMDRDQEDCVQLKTKLEAIAQGAGLVTKSSSGGDAWQLVNRLAIEELEAWFFGDLDAIRSAFPSVPSSLSSRAKYRDPDAIQGGTWEALEQVLQRAGQFRSGYRKLEAARLIGGHLDPARNRSRSFQVFRDTFG